MQVEEGGGVPIDATIILHVTALSSQTSLPLPSKSDVPEDAHTARQHAPKRATPT